MQALVKSCPCSLIGFAGHCLGSFSLPPVDFQLGWEAQPCRCNFPNVCRNCIDCDHQSITVHDAFMQFMYHTCMATSWPKTKNLAIYLITPHNLLHKKNIGSRSKWKSLFKDLCNWLLCFSQSSAQKDHQKWTQIKIALQNLKSVQIWSPYQASKNHPNQLFSLPSPPSCCEFLSLATPHWTFSC